MADKDKLIKQVKQHLEPGENIEATVHGTYETKIMGSDSVRSGILSATDRRIVFYAKKLGGYDLESFNYENISSFVQSKNMMGHAISFFASGNNVGLKWISEGSDMQAFVSAVKARQVGGSRSNAAAASPTHVVPPAPTGATASGNGGQQIMDQIRQVICPNCRKLVDNPGEECPHCGLIFTKFKRSQQSTPEAPGYKNQDKATQLKKTSLLVGLVLGVFGFAALLHDFRGPGGNTVPDYSVIGERGLTKFINIPSAFVDDRFYYQWVIQEECSESEFCFLMFFVDSASVDLAINPIFGEPLEKNTATYIQNPSTGARRLTFSCRVMPDDDVCF